MIYIEFLGLREPQNLTKSLANYQSFPVHIISLFQPTLEWASALWLLGQEWEKSENQFIEPERPKNLLWLSSGSSKGCRSRDEKKHGITSENDKVAIINHRAKVENQRRLLIRELLWIETRPLQTADSQGKKEEASRRWSCRNARHKNENDDGPSDHYTWVMISLKIIEKNEVRTREKLLG